MTILFTVDPEIPVPPLNYGGIERIVDSLIRIFKKENHQVYLVANSESTNQFADKIFGWPRNKSKGWYNIALNTRFLDSVVNTVNPDIIHSFSRLLYLYPIFLTKSTPVLQTYQRKISSKSTTLANMIAGSKLRYTSCGSHMVNNRKISEFCQTVHNFTDTDYFLPNENIPKNYLCYLGRIEEIKGILEAVQIAISTEQKLVIAGNIQPGHEEYFDTIIKPYLSNPLIEYLGPVNDHQKLALLQGAKALLFPIKWEEPFGIVMAEAMSCGVPVIGLRRGSVPEVIQHNETGFIADDIEEMVEYVFKLDDIDRSKVREDCLKRFSLIFISKEYLKIYKYMLEQ